MPGCSIEREVIGTTARYSIAGRFEAACAWELAGRVEKEPLFELTLDFSRCSEFVDHGIAVLSNALLAVPGKRVHLQGLRQHQLRLFKYFGVDADELLQRSGPPPHHLGTLRLASEVA